MKKTDVFDKLDNTIGNYMEGKADEQDMIKAAIEVNKYLFNHPHPHGVDIKESDGVVGYLWSDGKWVTIGC